jgi:FdhD protein
MQIFDQKYNSSMAVKGKVQKLIQPDEPAEMVRFRRGTWDHMPGRVIIETPVDLAVNGQHWLTFMCTPTHLRQLAIGFLYNEEIIQGMEEVVTVDICESGDQADVWLRHLADKPTSWRRTSGCSGGVTSAPETSRNSLLVEPDSVQPGEILAMMADFLGAQDLYRRTRGVHSSALSDGTQLLFQAEDIGRHNTLDKLAGMLLGATDTPKRRFLLTTGRISSEMLQKSARMQAPVVVSRTAPNSMSIRMAVDLGITLIGYARRDEFIVYAHPERLCGR